MAPVYDVLARIVFGNAIVVSQTVFLEQIGEGSKILILGGGTGWLLNKIDERDSSCEVWYVELSERMIERACKRKMNCKIHFIQGTEELIPVDKKFDVVITNFYLDLFSNDRVKRVIDRINHHTHASTLWIITDFKNTIWWQRCMLRCMYTFFRIVCKIEASQLPDWPGYLGHNGWREDSTRQWYNGFIESSIWNRR